MPVTSTSGSRSRRWWFPAGLCLAAAGMIVLLFTAWVFVRDLAREGNVGDRSTWMSVSAISGITVAGTGFALMTASSLESAITAIEWEDAEKDPAAEGADSEWKSAEVTADDEEVPELSQLEPALSPAEALAESESADPDPVEESVNDSDAGTDVAEAGIDPAVPIGRTEFADIDLGPVCMGCGERNRPAARYCDQCGERV